MRHFLLFITAIVLMVSCDESTSTIGTSLLKNTSEDVDVTTATYNVESQSIRADNVVARSATGYIGKIKDPETGTYVTCNFMTQLRGGAAAQIAPTSVFNPAYDFNNLKADTCQLVVYFNKFYGDSLAQMKVVAHELETPFEEDQFYDADIDSLAKEYIRKDGGLHIQNSYTYANHMFTYTERAQSTYPYVVFPLNEKYIAKDGTEYDSYGTYLLKKIYANPEKAKNDYWFIHNICPGFYLETVGGVGNLATIAFTQLFVSYTPDKTKSKTDWVISFPGTEEVLQKTAIIQSQEDIDYMTEDNSCTYLKTPAGIFTELSLPIDSIMMGHEDDTLSTTRIFLPRINNPAIDKYNLPIPQTVLLVQEDSVYNFFINNKVNDSKMSYLASYNSSYNGYTFGNISTLVNKIYRAKKESGLSDDAYKVQHPYWDKVLIIPVETTSSTLSTGTTMITKVTFDMSLGCTKLKIGSFKNNNITASCIYSRFK